MPTSGRCAILWRRHVSIRGKVKRIFEHWSKWIMINFLLIVLSTVCNVYSVDFTKTAVPGEFKYFVTIWNQNEYQCSGNIIDRRHILTRAYCISGIPSSHLSVIAGTVDTKDVNRVTFSVESVHIHYGLEAIIDSVVLDRIYWVHDIAILKLSAEMIWNSALAPIELISDDYDWNLNHKCVVPGWRPGHFWKTHSRLYMRWIDATIASDRECIAAGTRIFKNEKCTYWRVSTVKANTFYSGSPIVCGNILIGISDGRRSKSFSTALNLFHYLDFIENSIDDTKIDVNPGEAPFVVSIWNQGSFKCGGIILDPSHIFTTGSCVRGARRTDIQVIAGHTQILKSNHQIKWLSVKDIEMHPRYKEIIVIDGPNFMQIKYNYAILTLTEGLVWSPTIGRARLSNTHFNATGQVCEAFRWHNAYTVNDEVLLQLVSSEELILNGQDSQRAGVFEADEFGVHSQYVQRHMNVDSSGTPVVCEGFVIGIIVPDFSQYSCPRNVFNVAPVSRLLKDVC